MTISELLLRVEELDREKTLSPSKIEEAFRCMGGLAKIVRVQEKALEFYANEENWCPIFCEGDVRTDILGDADVKNYGEPDAYSVGGKRAREALAAASRAANGED